MLAYVGTEVFDSTNGQPTSNLFFNVFVYQGKSNNIEKMENNTTKKIT